MDGIIIIDKQKKDTSHDVVQKVKKILKAKKVGHTGTLDPNATGVLPILLDAGTKLSKYLTNHDKVYQVVLKLGEKRDTADSEGNIIKEEKVKPEVLKQEKIENAFSSFIGEQTQIPPMYSAIKVKGKKLYEYARKGEKVEIAPRKITIYNLTFLAQKETEITFRVACSKGTYIRSLCEDIAEKLGTVGYMKELRREQVGNFSLQDAITIKELEEHKDDIEYLKKHVISIEQFYQDKESIILKEKELTLFLNGVLLTYPKKDDYYRIYKQEGKFIGIGTIEKARLKREIVI